MASGDAQLYRPQRRNSISAAMWGETWCYVATHDPIRNTSPCSEINSNKRISCPKGWILLGLFLFVIAALSEGVGAFVHVSPRKRYATQVFNNSSS